MVKVNSISEKKRTNPWMIVTIIMAVLVVLSFALFIYNEKRVYVMKELGMQISKYNYEAALRAVDANGRPTMFCNSDQTNCVVTGRLPKLN